MGVVLRVNFSQKLDMLTVACEPICDLSKKYLICTILFIGFKPSNVSYERLQSRLRGIVAMCKQPKFIDIYARHALLIGLYFETAFRLPSYHLPR